MIYTNTMEAIWAALRSIDPTMSLDLSRVTFTEELRVGEDGILVRLVVRTESENGTKETFVDYREPS